MKDTYVVYLGAKPLMCCATFAEALEFYAANIDVAGLNIRNVERSDVDDNGLTEDERAQLEAV